MGKKNRNRFLDRAAAVSLNAALAAIGLLPYRARLATAGWTGRTFVSRNARLRRRVTGNLAHVMPELSESDRARIAGDVGDTFGRSFYEILNNRAFHKHAAWTTPGGEGAEAVLAAARAGKGAVMVTGHFGQWEAVRGWLRANGVNSGAIYRPTENGFINARYLDNLEFGGTPIFAKNRRAFRALVGHLSKGGIVAILTDQYEHRARRIDFIGQPAPTSFVAAELALKFGVPLIPAYGIRQPDGEHVRIAVEAPIPHSNAREMMQTVNDSLAAQVRAHPGQYYWLHRRWEKKLPGFSG